MGEVYRARDTRLDRTVAIKVCRSRFAADPLFRERFDREARAISQLTHPHICTLYDVGEHAGHGVLVMEYSKARRWPTRLKKGALPPMKR
jgi:serine/threonine protein kinase